MPYMAIVTSTVKALTKCTFNKCDDQHDHSQMMMSEYKQNQSQIYQLKAKVIIAQL